MRIGLPLVLAAALVGGCGMNSGTRGTESTPGDMGLPGSGDGSTRPPPVDGGSDLAITPIDDHSDGGGVGSLGDGGVFNPPGDMGSVMHAPPGTLAGVVVLGAGTDFRDVSTDEGHGVWATTSGTVYYFHGGATSTYGVGNGLAQGQSTWTSDYWCGPGFGGTCPATYNVTFTSVAGGLPGEVVVGHLGYIADRMNVDPSTGAVQSVVGLQVTATQQPDPTELQAQQQREVASWKVIVDLNGTFNGTAYMGGWHGTSAFHNIGSSRTSGICGSGCGDFEEHIHGFFNGGTQPGGRDVHALAITPEGDLWMGDADVISFVPQRSAGANADFFQPVTIPGQPNASALDVFPGVNDNTYGLALDKSRGIYVASYGNGLAYLAPGSYAPTYWSTADKLPQDYLTGVVVDDTGDVWIATASAGVVRYQPSSQTWVYYTTASGLPSNDIRAIYLDKYAASGRGVYFATDNGVAVYTGP
ncbi:MAG: Glycine-rich cell wall structural protein 1 precursor [bacterium]|nr:Glycine-rich cell wall structural protein 1 precursor [bacterium]